VGTNTINDRRELIDYDDNLDNLTKKVKRYLYVNYGSIKNYKITFAHPDDYAVLLYRVSPCDQWETKELFNIEFGKPQDFYDAWSSGDGSLTKRAVK
jgi:hypothetical protein